MYDVDDQREYIKNNFKNDVLKTFDSLNSYTKKSELWKYCILYKKGGIYLDTKYTIKKPLVEYIATHPIIFNGDTSFIAVPPNLDIFKLMIDGYVNKLLISFTNIITDLNYNKYITLQNDNNKCKDKYSDDIIFEFD
jgi:mannosyltransferase OCH1-like enzyme